MQQPAPVSHSLTVNNSQWYSIGLVENHFGYIFSISGYNDFLSDSNQKFDLSNEGVELSIIKFPQINVNKTD